MAQFTLGQRVWDLPSGMIATITDVRPHSMMSGRDDTFYTVSDNIPLDPTGDGAFPSRYRCEFEIDHLCNSHQHLDEFRNY